MTRTPITAASQVQHRFVATHPDGTMKCGKWSTKSTAEYEATEYAKEWLATIRRLGLEGQKIRMGMQMKTEETRVFISRPTMTAEYSQLKTDHYGNFRGIS